MAQTSGDSKGRSGAAQNVGSALMSQMVSIRGAPGPQGITGQPGPVGLPSAMGPEGKSGSPSEQVPLFVFSLVKVGRCTMVNCIQIKLKHLYVCFLSMYLCFEYTLHQNN